MRSVWWLGALVFAVSCGGAGPSCGGCSPSNYAFPSRVMQGAETVDDGVRARLTERGLDFLAANLKEIIRQQFPPMPGSPNQSRFELPTTVIADQDTGFGDLSVCLQGNSDPAPPPCVRPNDANKVSAVLIDLTDLENKLKVDFINVPESGIRVTANDILLGLDGRIRTEVSPFDLATTNADCDVFGDTSLPGGPFPAGTIGAIDIVADIFPRVSTDPAICQMGAPQCFTAEIIVRDAAVRGVGLGVVTAPRCTGPNTPANCSPACSDATGLSCSGVTSCYSNILCPDPGDCECRSFFCPVYGFGADAIGQIADFLFTFLQPLLDNFLTNALSSALDQFNGQPLAFTGQMDLASFAGDQLESLKTANPLGFTISPTNNAFQVTCPIGDGDCNLRRGMDLYLKTGIEAVHNPAAGKPSPNECVPAIEGAKFISLYAATAFETPDGAPLSGEFLDENGSARIYDIGASLAAAALNQAGFAAYNAGALCLTVDSYAVHRLGGGAFQLTAGALDLLTGGRLTQFVDPRAPILITLAPEEPPVFTLGQGTEMDPHMKLTINNMHVSIYVLMYERWARLFEVKADVLVGLNVTPNPMTRELNIALVQGPELNNFQQIYNELLPDVDWGTLLPSLLNVALGAFLNQDISFNFDVAPLLADALNIPVYIVFEALKTEQVNGAGAFLNLYLSFSSTDPNPVVLPQLPPMQPHREVQTWYLDEHDSPRATGFARIGGVLDPLPQDMVYAWRVDFGPWSAFAPPDEEGVLYVQDSKLALVGQHVVDVRAMKAGNWSSQTQDFRRMTVWTDAMAPHLWVNRLEGRIAVRAEDRVADPQFLEMRYQLDGRSWTEWAPVADIPNEALGDAYVLEVEVRDPAKNVAKQVLTLRYDRVPGAARDTKAAESSSSCACAEPVATGMPWLGVLALLGVVGRRRRT